MNGAEAAPNAGALAQSAAAAISLKVSLGANSRVAPRAVGAGQVSGCFRHARWAAQTIRLDASSGHRFCDLWLGGRVTSVLYVACGSDGARVARRSLLGEGPAPTTASGRLALHDVLLGSIPGVKRTVRLDIVPGEVSRA